MKKTEQNMPTVAPRSARADCRCRLQVRGSKFLASRTLWSSGALQPTLKRPNPSSQADPEQGPPEPDEGDEGEDIEDMS